MKFGPGVHAGSHMSTRKRQPHGSWDWRITWLTRHAAENGPLQLGHHAPFRSIITGTVLAMILRSSAAERRSRYWRSKATLRRTSSSFVS